MESVINNRNDDLTDLLLLIVYIHYNQWMYTFKIMIHSWIIANLLFILIALAQLLNNCVRQRQIKKSPTSESRGKYSSCIQVNIPNT